MLVTDAMLLTALTLAAVLTVGDGKTFARVESALDAARPGDRIEVSAKSGGYPRTSLIIRKKGITLKAVGHVELSGDGFDYSGVGAVPRAIIQIEADGVTVDGFELDGAHNESYNGAGIRINGGSNATIRNCDIHGNDMGIMSNGRSGDPHAAEHQLIESCRIHGNGNTKDPGYNHNLYLGGSSVTLRLCDIYGSLTGHNVKSRAHYTQIEYCRIHDSANRECDFVEAWDTERPNSNAVLIGNVIAKDPQCAGNRVVIHFGKEKGIRDGFICLINNTIVTPFQSPVVALTQPTARAGFFNNVIVNTEEARPQLVSPPNTEKGVNNWLSSGYKPADGLAETTFGQSRSTTPLGPDLRVDLALKPVEGTYVDGQGALHKVKLEYRFDGKSWRKSNAAFVGAG